MFLLILAPWDETETTVILPTNPPYEVKESF